MSDKERLNRKYLWLITFIIFFLSAGIHFLMSDFEKALEVYPDELRYWHISNSLFQNGEIWIRGQNSGFQKILYPLFIMPVHIFHGYGRIKCLAFLNSVYMSSAVFPILLLSMHFLKKNWQVMIVLITSVILPTMSMSMTFMSENIYFPLSMWYFYILFAVVEERRMFYKVVGSIAIGVLNYLLYLNKEVALAFLIAYLMVETCNAIRDKSNIKLYLTGGIALISFSICFLAMKLTLFKGLGNSYNQMSIDAVASVEQVIFLIYTFVYNSLFGMVSFFVFPVILPLMYWKNMNKKEKTAYLLTIVSFFIILATISYTISIREDWGKISIRQHLRYFEPLFVPFFILFLRIMTRDEEETILKMKKKWWLLLIALAFLIVSVLRNIGIGSPVDGCMLKYYEVFQNDTVSRGLILRFLIGCAVILGGLLISKVKKKWLVIVMTGGIWIVCIINHTAAFHIFNTEYKISEEHLSEWEQLNALLKEKNCSVLVVLNDYYDADAKFLDTYMEVPFDYVICSEAESDIQTEGKYQYILSCSSWKIENEEAVECMNCGPFILYEVPYSETINTGINFCFPINKNEKRTILASSGKFWTQFEMEEGKFSYVSGEDEGFLICGPYTKIIPGRYDITAYYEYDGSLEKGSVIGKLDLKYSSEEPQIYAELKAGSNQVQLKDVLVYNEFDSAEVRIYTTVPGVKFQKVEIVNN